MSPLLVTLCGATSDLAVGLGNGRHKKMVMFSTDLV